MSSNNTDQKPQSRQNGQGTTPNNGNSSYTSQDWTQEPEDSRDYNKNDRKKGAPNARQSEHRTNQPKDAERSQDNSSAYMAHQQYRKAKRTNDTIVVEVVKSEGGDQHPSNGHKSEERQEERRSAEHPNASKKQPRHQNSNAEESNSSNQDSNQSHMSARSAYQQYRKGKRANNTTTVEVLHSEEDTQSSNNQEGNHQTTDNPSSNRKPRARSPQRKQPNDRSNAKHNQQASNQETAEPSSSTNTAYQQFRRAKRTNESVTVEVVSTEEAQQNPAAVDQEKPTQTNENHKSEKKPKKENKTGGKRDKPSKPKHQKEAPSNEPSDEKPQDDQNPQTDATTQQEEGQQAGTRQPRQKRKDHHRQPIDQSVKIQANHTRNNTVPVPDQLAPESAEIIYPITLSVVDPPVQVPIRNGDNPESKALDICKQFKLDLSCVDAIEHAILSIQGIPVSAVDLEDADRGAHVTDFVLNGLPGNKTGSWTIPIYQNDDCNRVSLNFCKEQKQGYTIYQKLSQMLKEAKDANAAQAGKQQDAVAADKAQDQDSESQTAQ